MRNTLNFFQNDLDRSLPKQIRSVVKEVMGGMQGKQASESAGSPTQQVTASPRGPRAARAK
jgi:hypothetical protein